MVSPILRRTAVKSLVEQGKCSKRCACRLVNISRSVAAYARKRADEEKELIERIKELAHKHRRYGYRRVSILLKQEGKRVNHKRVYRLWKVEGLSLKKSRFKRRKVAVTKAEMKRAEYPNHVWTYDFIDDATEKGCQIRILNVVDEFSREYLAVRVGRSITSQEVIEVLDYLSIKRGMAAYIRSDNGPEFIAKAVKAWLDKNGARSIYINPGSPWENSYIESFHGKLRDECLNQEIFSSIEQAGIVLENWREEYNNYRPHSSLGGLSPSVYMRRYQESLKLEALVT
jgi:transposase InsO family protein